MSPTIVNEDGYRIIIWPNDHTPPHVHVRRAEAEAKVNLEVIEITDSENFSGKQRRKILEIVKKYREKLLQEWDKIHSSR